jgi:NADPH:quinone reductase-like Zn-dependent oxidoreductase
MHAGTGFELAGEIVELGSGVSNFKPGDKVIAINFPVSVARYYYCTCFFKSCKRLALF